MVGEATGRCDRRPWRSPICSLAALFAQGLLSLHLVTSIVWHTAPIDDPMAMRAADAALAKGQLQVAPSLWDQLIRSVRLARA